ncbi:hypothetical protein SAMN05216327_10660 [Dyadobacter sp. SG02]|uniref:T9SS type A sorting domain-containing protein n=1 Tax=Dyadobacter sp. SG02 TaxID=1855291 RepID=UPI0008AC5E0E|nr:T9SS type A sorting domain-containing protein [Dyadobacter sp. SG02]SEJ09948.1 hypothetical protein SAMN05216327_10660 [Dyadobacter sp. SG02]
MKNLLLLFCLAVITAGAKAQTCGAGGLTFSTQAEINSFTTNFPGCTQVLGDITVTGATITNLNGLSGVTSIGGSMFIYEVPLTNLTGLGALTKISGGLNLSLCPSLTSLTGLSALTEISGQLTVWNTAITNFSGLPLLTKLGSLSLRENTSMTSFTGLSGITSLQGWLYVSDNPVASTAGLENLTSVGQLSLFNSSLNFSGLTSLTTIVGPFEAFSAVSNFNGLGALESIGGTFEVHNPGVLSLAGLTSLESIGGDLVIANTSSLSSLNGLQALKSIGGKIDIYNNEFLSTLSGIDNVDATTFSDLSISNSPFLNNCNVKSICIYLDDPTNPAAFSDNQVGCNSRAAILATTECQTALPVYLASFSGMATPEGNKLVWNTTWEANNKGFAVERIDNLMHFTEIGFVAGNTDSKRSTGYSFTDFQKIDKAYYRLKQIDWDGAFNYSRIISVGGKPSIDEPAYVYPNPVRGQLVIGNGVGQKSYRLMNKQGVSLMESKILPNTTVDVSKLPNDLYFLEVGRDVIKVVVNND